MITVWLIGLILSFLGIYLFKGSRIKATKKTWDNPAKPERPVLKVWHTILYLIGAQIPIIAIIMALTMILFWAVEVYGDEEWTYPNSLIASKVMKFLNKPIT